MPFFGFCCNAGRVYDLQFHQRPLWADIPCLVHPWRFLKSKGRPLIRFRKIILSFLNNMGYNNFDTRQKRLPQNKITEKENGHEICM